MGNAHLGEEVGREVLVNAQGSPLLRKAGESEAEVRGDLRGGGEMESVGVLMRENMALGCSLCGRRTNLGAGEGRGHCATATEPVHDGGAVGDCR